MLSCFEPDIFRIKPDISWRAPSIPPLPEASLPPPPSGSTKASLLSSSIDLIVPTSYCDKSVFAPTSLFEPPELFSERLKKAVGAWSVGVVFILFFLSALIWTRRAWQCLAWWKSVMAHWKRVGLFSISSDLSLKRLRWAALKVLGWVDVTRHNVLF